VLYSIGSVLSFHLVAFVVETLKDFETVTSLSLVGLSLRQLVHHGYGAGVNEVR